MGAIGAASQLAELQQALSTSYTVHVLNFSGHGGLPLGNTVYSIHTFANGVLDYLAQHNISKINILGYSMGGYVAMYLAKNHPDRVNKIATLATKYNWDEAIAAKEIQMLNPEKIEQKLPSFADALAKRHAPENWKEVLARTAQMMLQMGADNPLKPADYTSIAHTCLILLGDKDKMVTLEETLAVYTALPNAQLGVLPNTPHPIEQVDVTLLSTLATRFFNS